MALQTSGAISIGDLRTEFGDTASSSLSEFYRGGSLVPNTASNTGVPTSGAIALSDFYGASQAVTISVGRSAGTVNEGDVFTFYATATTAITGTVNFSLGGTATGGGTDYSTSGASGSFTFSNSTTSNTVTISTVADSTIENDETVSCTISSPSVTGFDTDIGTSSTSVTIKNVVTINLTPATHTLSILDEDGTVSASGGIQLQGTSSANTYVIGTIIDGSQTTDQSNIWITGGDPADYEARVTVTSGTVDSNVSFTNFGTGTSIGSWTTLSGTSYVWAYQTTTQLTNTFTITLQIRDSATQTVQDSAAVTLNFETVYSGA